MDTEGTKLEPHRVWSEAWQRFQKKAAACSELIKTKLLRADSCGDEPPNLEKAGGPTAPLASFDANGRLVWDETLSKRIAAMGEPPQKRKRK